MTNVTIGRLVEEKITTPPALRKADAVGLNVFQVAYRLEPTPPPDPWVKAFRQAADSVNKQYAGSNVRLEIDADGDLIVRGLDGACTSKVSPDLEARIHEVMRRANNAYSFDIREERTTARRAAETKKEIIAAYSNLAIRRGASAE